jgi:dihydrofolate reductase
LSFRVLKVYASYVTLAIQRKYIRKKEYRDMKVSVYIATSLDGYIARADGGLDWLDEANATVPDGEDMGYHSFMNSIDCMVMGRKTFEKVLSFGEWHYGETPVVVLSHNPIPLPPSIQDSVTHSSEAPLQLLNRLSAEGLRHVYVDGGLTIQGFLSEGLVDEITVTVIPVILGSGIPLFGSTANDIGLTHVRTTVFDFGLVQTTYSVKKSG